MLGGYAKTQVKFIKLLAKHFHLSEEQATKSWIKNGMAHHFAELYRDVFDLPKEK